MSSTVTLLVAAMTALPLTTPPRQAYVAIALNDPVAFATYVSESNVNSKSAPERFETVLERVVTTNYVNPEVFIAIIAARGGTLDSPYPANRPPLFHAVNELNARAVTALAEHGATLSIRDPFVPTRTILASVRSMARSATGSTRQGLEEIRGILEAHGAQ